MQSIKNTGLWIWLCLLHGFIQAASPYDSEFNGEIGFGWTAWNEGNFITYDYTIDPGWVYLRHHATEGLSSDWGMNFYNASQSDMLNEPTPYAVEAHWKQDPPDGQPSYLQLLTLSLTSSGWGGQTAYISAGKGYSGTEQRIIAYSGSSYGGKEYLDRTAANSFTDSGIENAAELYVIIERLDGQTVKIGFKASSSAPWSYLPAITIPAITSFKQSFVQMPMMFNGDAPFGNTLDFPEPGPTGDPSHWTYKVDYLRFHQNYIPATSAPTATPTAEGKPNGIGQAWWLYQ